MTRWYQEAVIDGRPMPHVRKRGGTSAERWRDLLAPLIAPNGEGRLFVELGCNAGYYLREARALGYRALGVERDYRYLYHAWYWETCEPRGVTVVPADLNDYAIPACHTCLLASIHYWLSAEQLSRLLARLRQRAMWLIVTGKDHGGSLLSPDQGHLMPYLAGWELTGETRRPDGYAVLARNPDLEEREVEPLYQAHRVWVRATGGHDDFFAAFEDYVRRVAAGDLMADERTAFWGYLRRHGLRYRHAIVGWYRQMIREALRGGIPAPIAVRGDEMLDGNHRLVIARELGWKYVVCRRAA